MASTNLTSYPSIRVGRIRAHAVLAGIWLMAVMALCVPVASADLTFGTQGTGAGQIGRGEGMAVDESTGDIFVGDVEDHRVDVFGPEGHFVRAFGWGVADGVSAELQSCVNECFRGENGTGPGELNEPKRIAIDNNAASPAHHDVYVHDGMRVERFSPAGELIAEWNAGSSGGYDPIAVSGPAGTVYVGTSEQQAGGGVKTGINEYTPSGTLLAQVAPVGADRLSQLAMRSNGDFIVGYINLNTVNEYDAVGTLLSSSMGGELTLDSAGDLFLAQIDHEYTVIGEYDSSGDIVRRFGYGEVTPAIAGLEVDHAASAGEVVFDDSQIHELAYPPVGPLVVAAPKPSSDVLATTASLRGYANPEGQATTYHFEYVDQHDFESEDGFASPHTQRTTESGQIGSDFELHTATADLTGLTPETHYRFRVTATNPSGTSSGAEASFETLPPLVIGSQWASEVTPEAALLHAEVDPVGVHATGYFEYVTDSQYRESGFAGASDAPDVPKGASPLDFGAGVTAATGTTTLFPLSPGTTYHYRLVTGDGFVTVYGAAQTFTTDPSRAGANESCPNRATRVGVSASLPDCRAYELVSPVEKNSGDALDAIDVTGYRTRLDQSAISGDGFAYTSARAFPGAPSAPYASEYLARRDPASGWATQAVSPAQGPADSHCCGQDFENDYQAFSPELSSGWLLLDGEGQLAAGGVEDSYNVYRRESTTGVYESLSTPEAGVAPGTLALGAQFDEMQGFTSDGSEAVFTTADKLSASGTGGVQQLYDWDRGALRFVCVLPNGTDVEWGCSAGSPTVTTTSYGRYNRVATAFSSDGKRVYWTTAPHEGLGTIYLRENPNAAESALSGSRCTEPDKACTVKVSETVSNEPAQFWAASDDGDRALFSIGEGLYRYELASKQPVLIAHNVAGVLGESADLSYVYFVSSDALSGAAQAGGANLYMYHEGNPLTFIATLSNEDIEQERGYDAIAVAPIYHASRVTPDGTHIVFMSSANISGYDNRDAVSGQPDAEVYTYQAGATSPVCVSCDPSGARPVGSDVHYQSSGGARWVAADVQGWENQLYAPRDLSDDGARVFFESYGALVPGDTNGTIDVYEWESAGTGDCTATAAAFREVDDGCLSLISSGESSEESLFMDASPTGSDVFFTTGQSLVPQDPGLVDVYDARVGGGFPLPVARTQCEGEACQNAAAPPFDATPSSLTFAGVGDAGSERVQTGTSKPKSKVLTRAQKLARALGRCHPKSPVKARRSCERKVRKAFGGKARRAQAPAGRKLKTRGLGS